LLFGLSTAIVISVIWGLSMLGILSFALAKGQQAKPWMIVAEHLSIALVVIVATHYVGHIISSVFG